MKTVGTDRVSQKNSWDSWEKSVWAESFATIQMSQKSNLLLSSERKCEWSICFTKVNELIFCVNPNFNLFLISAMNNEEKEFISGCLNIIAVDVKHPLSIYFILQYLVYWRILWRETLLSIQLLNIELFEWFNFLHPLIYLVIWVKPGYLFFICHFLNF